MYHICFLFTINAINHRGKRKAFMYDELLYSSVRENYKKERALISFMSNTSLNALKGHLIYNWRDGGRSVNSKKLYAVEHSSLTGRLNKQLTNRFALKIFFFNPVE